MKKSEHNKKSITIRFFNDVEALVDEIFEIPSSFTDYVYDPATDLFETEDLLYLVMEIPGVKKEDLSIAIGPTMILVQGVKLAPDFVHRVSSFHNLEISYGNFRKRIHLPCRIKTPPVQISFQDGVLIMEFNKYKKSVRTIKIE